ncbi:MAG: SDR family oxidoreductase [Synergistales bacterium]|nr:SDR family oxidoreductase [Synergistales bacterium]
MDFQKTFGLEGKVAVVTGAASGIGRGCARFLAETGASVVLADINRSDGEAAVSELGKAARFVECDVTSADSCRRMAETVGNAFGGVDILVNCAGVIRRQSVVDLEEKDWDISLDVTLKGVYMVSRFVVPLLERRGGGSIINIGSGWGISGGPKAAAYCAAKGGVVNLTRAMCIDHGPQNIRVNCVSPGDVDTPLLREEGRQLGMDEQEWLKESADRPIARLGRPEDIARAVYFLASDLSQWVSGANLVVDGGGTA